MTPLEILEAHTFGHSLLTVRGFCDGCDWHSYTGPKVAVEAHRAHLAEVLDKHMQEREAGAWRKGVDTALNHAIQNPDGITLRLEHLDGRPWANPYANKELTDGR